MPLIKFDNKEAEGFYVLVTNGEVGCFPHGVHAVTDLFLRQVTPLLQERGIRYHRLTSKEADQLLNQSSQKTTKKKKKAS